MIDRNLTVESFLRMNKEDVNTIQRNLMAHKAKGHIKYEDYVSMIKVRCEKIFLERGLEQPFNIDKYNEKVIQELYCYLTCHPKGNLNPHVGIIMMGNVGCGKTALLKAHCEISSMVSSKVITYVHAEKLVSLIKEHGDAPYTLKPMLIDELGREKIEAKNYGEALKPITDLLALRYDSGARTYATTNFKMDSLEEIYKQFIRSRMDEMMNVVVLPGPSRRRTHELK